MSLPEAQIIQAYIYGNHACRLHKKFRLHFIKVLAILYLVKIFLKTNLTDIGMAG